MANNRYLTIRDPISHKMIYRHRLIWEQYNNASLLPWTNIHHKNGDRRDNHPENLIPIHIGKHVELHLQEKRINEINKRKCAICDNGTYYRLKNIGRYHYRSADWHKNPLNKSQLICRKCFRRIMNKEFHKRV